jgi:hypothetical protein
MQHGGQRSLISIAKQYCFDFGKFDSKLQDNIFVGSPEDLKVFVEVGVPDAYLADLPDLPQGIVLADNRGTESTSIK